MTKHILISLLLTAAFFAPAIGAQAQEKPLTFCRGGICLYTPLEPIPCYNSQGVQLDQGRCQTGNNFPLLVANMFRLLLTLGSIFAIVMLTVAGIGYMLSEAAVDIDKAKKRARAALWGLILLIGCWLILYTVNPNLLKFDIFEKSLQTFKPKAQSPIQTTTGVSGSIKESYTTTGESGENKKIQDFILRCTGPLGGKIDPVRVGKQVQFNCVQP